MWSLLIFIPVIALTVIVSRKNMGNRVLELTNNATSYAEELRTYYYSLDNESQEKFFALLDKDESDYFKILLNNVNLNYGKNSWQIQQYLIRQQEIMNKLQKFK